MARRVLRRLAPVLASGALASAGVLGCSTPPKAEPPIRAVAPRPTNETPQAPVAAPPASPPGTPVIIPASAAVAAPDPMPAPSPGTPTTSGAYRLTLEEARQRALTCNTQLGLAHLNIDEKHHALAAARKDYLPKVLGNVSYFHFDKDLGSVVTLRTGALGLLPPGTSTLGVAIANQNSSLSTVMLAQPITKLIAVNAATQLARADENIARAQLDKGAKDVLSGVTQAYHGLLGTQRIQAALELQAKLLEQVAGAKPTPELRIALLEVRQGILQAKGQAQELTGELNGLLNLPSGTVLELVDPLPAPPTVGSVDEAIRTALMNNPEVREAEQSIAKANAARQLARMDYLPDVNVIGGYANQTMTNSIQPNIGYVGVAASYTFWDWGKRGDVRRQRATQLAMAYQNLQASREKVQSEARKAFEAYEQAREAHRLADEMVKARKDAEKNAAGPAAGAEAKQATAKAELELMKAEIAYRVAHAQLVAAIGC